LPIIADQLVPSAGVKQMPDNFTAIQLAAGDQLTKSERGQVQGVVAAGVWRHRRQ
jgi:hypothetical protein